MNLLEFISILSGILSAISAFLLVLLANPTVKNKSNNRKRIKLIYIITLIISLVVLVLSIIITNIQNLDIYNKELDRIWVKASSDGNNGNFGEAASGFHQVAIIAKNNKLKCQAYLNEADCYMRLGYLTMDSNHFRKALYVYDELIEFGEYPQHQIVHSQILTGIGISYVFLGDIEDLVKFSAVIEEMYSFLPIEDVEKYGPEAINYCILRSMIAGWYNEAQYRNTHSPEYLALSKQLFEEVLPLEELYEQRSNSVDESLMFKNSLFMQVGEYYYMLSQVDQGSACVNDLHSSIAYYSKVRYSEDDDHSIEFNALKAFGIARSYIALSYASPVNCDQNRWNAYSEVKPFLSITDNSLDHITMYMCPVVISSGYFTEDDETKILDIFHRLLATTSLNDRPKDYINIKMQLLFTYSFLYRLKQDQIYFDNARLIYEEFQSVLYELMDRNQLEDINNIWNEVVLAE